MGVMKSHNLLSESWRNKKASDVIPSDCEDLRTRAWIYEAGGGRCPCSSKENKFTLPLSFCSIQALSLWMPTHIGEKKNFFFFFFLMATFFLKFIWQCGILVLALGIFSCSMWDLVPWLGIKPGHPALGAQSLSHWTIREVPGDLLYSA